MALNLTPVSAGLVVVVGDDPGAYGSQNDQDSRMLSKMMELPWLEPSDPGEAYEITMSAYDGLKNGEFLFS